MYDPRITLPGSAKPPPAAPPRRSRVLAVVYEGRRIPLTHGDVLLGRAATCHVAIDEMMVSRVHAKIVVTEDAVIVRDMGSTNGVFVNGARIERPTPLREGDILSLGAVDLSIEAWVAPPESGDVPQADAKPEQSVATTPPAHTSKVDALEHIGMLAQRLLKAGQIEMAERALSGHLRQVIEASRDGRAIPASTITQASTCALALAAARNDARWFDYVVELHLLKKRPMDALLTDRVALLVRQLVPFDRELFGRYRAMLQTQERTMSLGDRVLCAKTLAIDPRR